VTKKGSKTSKKREVWEKILQVGRERTLTPVTGNRRLSKSGRLEIVKEGG